MMNESISTNSIDQPYATILGEPLTSLPQDLYIPKDPLQVFLESFTGPLDLLLYLIKKQNISILDIPIAKITAQYLEYIELKKQLQLELAAEYLVMAAMLAEIKSKMLLPKPKATENEEDDPRTELVRKLQEYERFKKIAETWETLPRMGRDLFVTEVNLPTQMKPSVTLPQVKLDALVNAYRSLLERAHFFEHHHIAGETLTLRERMGDILKSLTESKILPFQQLFKLTEGRLGVVVTFIAILELIRQATIEIVQTETFGAIYVKAK